VRIDVVGPVHPWRGGIAHHTARLARELIARDHDVRVLTFTRQYPALLFPGTTQLDRSGEPVAVPSEQRIDSIGPGSWVRVGRDIARRRPDRLVFAWWHPFFAPAFGAIAALARRAGVEVVFVCHNVLPHESSPVDRALARLAFRGASRFVVQAQAERDRLEQLVPGASVAVCPHPAYDVLAEGGHREHPAEARTVLGLSSSRALLFFGLIRPYKGLDVLIDAMALLPKRLRDVELLVAGECYGDEEIYRGQVARLGLGDRVRLELRYVANEEIPTLMCAADAVVLPYRHATQSGVAQVAFAAGRPVITTAVGGLPDVVHDGENGLLVPPADPQALAAAIARFYDEGLAAALAAGARASAATNGWAALAAAIEGEPS
jgi:D-inositol-3-phosphate glycosyltransferase